MKNLYAACWSAKQDSGLILFDTHPLRLHHSFDELHKQQQQHNNTVDDKNRNVPKSIANTNMYPVPAVVG